MKSKNIHLQCDYSDQGHPTKFSTNLTNKNRVVFQKITQNDQNSVVFVMNYKDNFLQNYCKHSRFFSLNL